jgi:hypothetical protein
MKVHIAPTELSKETAAVEAVLEQADPPDLHTERVKALQADTSSAKDHVAQLEREKRYVFLVSACKIIEQHTPCILR